LNSGSLLPREKGWGCSLLPEEWVDRAVAKLGCTPQTLGETMKSVKAMFLIGALCMMSIFFYGRGFSQSPQPSVQLTTEPPINQILPFEAEATQEQSPVMLNLQALDATGQALENATMQVQLLTPPKLPWFTTDFPIVEGTTLLDMTTIAPQGRVQFQQMLPIRGNYALRVNITPGVSNAFAPFEKTLALGVPENSVKYRNYGILLAILLGVGFGGGWVIAGRQPLQWGEIAPERVRLLLSGLTVVAIVTLLYVNLSAELSQSSMSMPMSHKMHDAPLASHPSQVQSQGLAVEISGDSGTMVGQLASFQVGAIDSATKQPVANVPLQIKATQLEDRWVSFSYQGVTDATGHLAWQQQFFDGAPHQLEVTVLAAPNSSRPFQPFQVAKTIGVEGVAPPFFTRFISLLYMMGAVSLGLLAGFWLCRRRSPSLG